MRFFLHDYLGMADIDEEDVEALFCAVDLSNSADVGFSEFLWCARARTPARARLRFSTRAAAPKRASARAATDCLRTRAARHRSRQRSIARSPRAGCDERPCGRLGRFMLSCEHFLPASVIAALRASGPEASAVRAAAAPPDRKPWEVARIAPFDHAVNATPPSRSVAAEEAGGEEAGNVKDIKEMGVELAALEVRARGERAAFRLTEARIAALENAMQLRLATGGSGIEGEEGKRGEDTPSPMPSGSRYRATKAVDALALAEFPPKRGATAARRCGTRDTRDPGIHGGACASRVALACGEGGCGNDARLVAFSF